MDKIIDVYTVNSVGVPNKRLKLLQLLSTLTELLLECGFAGCCLCGILFIVNPIFSYVWMHEMRPMLPVYTPFIDENTLSGFIQLTLIHTVFIVSGVIGTASVDFMIVMIVLNVPIFTIIFSDNVQELNDIMHAKNDRRLGGEGPDKSVMVKAKLRNLFFMFGDICKWVISYNCFHTF